MRADPQSIEFCNSSECQWRSLWKICPPSRNQVFETEKQSPQEGFLWALLFSVSTDGLLRPPTVTPQKMNLSPN
jgi:hypothetical protein